MFKDIKITCQRKVWDSSVKPEDVNLFSSITPTIIGELTELQNWMVATESLKIKYEFEYTRNEQLFYKCSDAKSVLSGYKLWNQDSKQYLEQYFRIYEDTEHTLFHVKIYFQNNLVYEGTVGDENIGQKISDTAEDRNITVNYYSIDKQFVEYYKSKPLPKPTDLSWLKLNPLGDKATNIGLLLDQIFPNVSIKIPELSIKEWLISNAPVFLPSVFIPNGYDRIYNEGENCYDFLYKLCNSMGWVFFFIYENDQRKLVIKNRSTVDSMPVVDIERKYFKLADVSKQVEVKYDNVLIPAGSIYGADEAFEVNGNVLVDNKGERFVLLQNQQIANQQGRHWNFIDPGGSEWVLEASAGYTFTKYNGEDAEDFRYFKREYTLGGDNKFLYSIPQKKILRINSGHNAVHQWQVNLFEKTNFPWSVGVEEPRAYDMILSGNYGQILYKGDTTFPQPVYQYGYEDYKSSNQLRENYSHVLRSSRVNKYINTKIDKPLFNMLAILRVIDNYETIGFPLATFREPFKLNRKFMVLGMETDLINNSTDANLII